MVLNDTPENVLTVKTFLEDNMFEIDSYKAPFAALQNFRPAKYDLVILSINQQEMDGFELYEKMLKIDNNIKVCFFAASQLRYGQIRDSLPASYTDRFIWMSIENEELIKQLDKIMIAPATTKSQE